MSTDENKALVRRFFEAVFEEKRLERTDELFAPDYLDHGGLPGQAPGLDGAKQKWAMYLAGMPDLHVPIDDLVAEGDKVVVCFTVEGTHGGELLGLPPTGRRLRATGISILRLAEGRIAENEEEGDRLGLLQQLGAIPSPAVPAPASRS
jgi:predicted ester cyclase